MLSFLTQVLKLAKFHSFKHSLTLVGNRYIFLTWLQSLCGVVIETAKLAEEFGLFLYRHALIELFPKMSWAKQQRAIFQFCSSLTRGGYVSSAATTTATTETAATAAAAAATHEQRPRPFTAAHQQRCSYLE